MEMGNSYCEKWIDYFIKEFEMEDKIITKIILPQEIKAKTPPVCERGEKSLNLVNVSKQEEVTSDA